MVKERHYTLNNEAVRWELVKRGLLEREMADMLLVNRTNFSKYMNGKRKMGFSKVQVMAGMFGVAWKELVVNE